MSESEYEVMEVIWSQNREITPGEVLDLLSTKKDWKYSTLRTFLARLTEKGLLECNKGRVNSYRAIISEEEYRKGETKKFMENVHKGSLKSMLASLCENDLSDEKLEHLLKEIEQQ